MPRTEAQQRASKKWAETHKEENIKRISECIKNRYENDEEFREKKKETERERQRAKKAAKDLAAAGGAAAATEAEAVPEPELPQDLLLAKLQRCFTSQTYSGF
jgi:hypothetical protein